MDAASLIYAARFLEMDVDSFIKGVDKKTNDLAESHDFDPDLFASNLVAARLARKMSQKVLAAKAGISSRSLKNYEACKSIPSLTVFTAFLNALKVSAADFLFTNLTDKKEFQTKKKRGLRFVFASVAFFAVFFTGGALTLGYALANTINNNSPVSRAVLDKPIGEGNLDEEIGDVLDSIASVEESSSVQ